MREQATSSDLTPGAGRRREGTHDLDDDAWLLRLYASLSSESMAWRQRVDVTSNWAIPLVIAISTFALGEPRLPHFALLALGGGMLAIAVVTDARRYREVHRALWRTQLVDQGYFAPRLDHVEGPPNWRTRLATDLRDPRPRLALWTSVKARMRTTYLALVYVLVIAWGVKVLVHPQMPSKTDELLGRMRIGVVPGEWVGAVVGLAVAILTIVVVRSPPTAQLEASVAHRTAASAAPG